MKNSLNTLSRIQKFNIDEQRKILFSYIDQEDKFQKGLNKINTEYDQEKKYCSQNGETKDFAAYLNRYLKNKDRLEKNLKVIRKKIEEQRDIIADMFKEQKTYEIVDENRKQSEQKRQDDNEQKMLDEIGTNTYIKKRK